MVVELQVCAPLKFEMPNCNLYTCVVLIYEFTLAGLFCFEVYVHVVLESEVLTSYLSFKG